VQAVLFFEFFKVCGIKCIEAFLFFVALVLLQSNFHRARMELNKNAILSLIKFAFSFTLFLPYTSIIAIGNRNIFRGLFTICWLLFGFV
jgi:hypothetical protein